MTSEERLDRIEHLTAGWIEQSKKEHQENRDLWRQTQTQIAETDRHLRVLADQFNEQMAQHRAEWREEMRVMREDMTARDRATDARIGELVSAIGAFIRKAS
jgi:hypothetical protein